jgi:hypothetical protein
VAKVITITDIRINAIRIERDDENNITLTADYQYKDESGIIAGINLQVNSEAKPLADFAAAVRDALIEINTYVENRIKTAEGI